MSDRDAVYLAALAAVKSEHDELLPHLIELHERLKHLRFSIKGLAFLTGTWEDVPDDYRFDYDREDMGGAFSRKPRGFSPERRPGNRKAGTGSEGRPRQNVVPGSNVGQRGGVQEGYDTDPKLSRNAERTDGPAAKSAAEPVPAAPDVSGEPQH